MANLLLAIFLVVFGLNMLLGLALPLWIPGALAIAAGIFLALEILGVGLKRPPR